MGRKIPGKKHRTIKDPYKQKQKRLDSIRDKVNNPPSNANEQEIPKSLLKIMELKNKAKQVVKKQPQNKKKNKGPVVLSVAKLIKKDKEPFQEGMTKPDRYIPNLVQKPNESANSFLRRVSTMTHNLINEVEFEKKFGVQIQKNQETGEVINVKRVKKKSTSKKQKLAEKRKEKLNQKKESLKNVKDFSQLKDKVEFGEVVHRPPALPKMKKQSETAKPKYSNLFLSNAIRDTQTKLTDPHRNLEKEKKESERRFIVEAYRKAKKQQVS